MKKNDSPTNTKDFIINQTKEGLLIALLVIGANIAIPVAWICVGLVIFVLFLFVSNASYSHGMENVIYPLAYSIGIIAGLFLNLGGTIVFLVIKKLRIYALYPALAEACWILVYFEYWKQLWK